MKFSSKDWCILYTDIPRNKSCFCVLSFNETHNRILIEYEATGEDLSGFDSDGVPYEAIYVSPSIFDCLTEHLEMSLDCDSEEGLPFHLAVATPDKKTENEAEIPEKTVQKGLRCLLSPEELEAIVQKPLAVGDYYDYDVLAEGIHKFMRGEISRDYYVDWVILVVWALNRSRCREGGKKRNSFGVWPTLSTVIPFVS